MSYQNAKEDLGYNVKYPNSKNKNKTKKTLKEHIQAL